MSKGTLQFWLLFLASIVLSAVIVTLLFKALKLILYLILILALAPLVYLVLKLLLPGRKSKQDKLGKRE